MTQAREKFSLRKRPAWGFLTVNKKKMVMFKLEFLWKKKPTQIWVNIAELLQWLTGARRDPGASETQVKAQSQSWGLWRLNSETIACEADGAGTTAPAASTNDTCCHSVLQKPAGHFHARVFMLLLWIFVLKRQNQQGENCAFSSHRLLNKRALGSAKAAICAAWVTFPVLNRSVCPCLKTGWIFFFVRCFSAVKPHSASGSWSKCATLRAVLPSYTDRIFLHKPALVLSGHGLLSSAM